MTEEHLEPIICFYPSKGKKSSSEDEMLCQIFNFVDVIGGKQGITSQNIEKVLKIRGLIEPSNANEAKELDSALVEGLQAATTANSVFSKKDLESYKFTTKGSHHYAESLDTNQLDNMNQVMEELDALDQIELDQNAFKFTDHLIGVFRDVADPFGREIKELKFESDPG